MPARIAVRNQQHANRDLLKPTPSKRRTLLLPVPLGSIPIFSYLWRSNVDQDSTMREKAAKKRKAGLTIGH
jgi:hypothetical protein